MRTWSLALAAALTVLPPVAGAASPSSVHTFSFQLEGSQTVPSVKSAGRGWVTVTVDDATRAYTVTGRFGCLNGDATAVHFHGPAAVGASGPIFENLSTETGTKGMISGSGTLTVDEWQDMQNGLVYVQLHSVSHLTGELRGQVLPCVAAVISTRNGTGVNPVALTATGPPAIGASWTLELDCSGHAPSLGLVVFQARRQPASPTNAGELLIQLQSKRLLRSDMPHSGNTVQFAYAIPSDTSLCGMRAFAQGLVLGAPGPQLTNALDLTFGL